MADISKIQIGSTTYNIKDETARNNYSDTLWASFRNDSVFTTSSDEGIRIRKIGNMTILWGYQVQLVNNLSAASIILVEKPENADFWVTRSGLNIPVIMSGSSVTQRSIVGHIGTSSGAITLLRHSTIDTIPAGINLNFIMTYV